MNSVLKATSLVALTCGLVACGGDTEDNTTAPQNYHDIKTNLQGTVFDAVTGERISTEGLKVTLVQGDKYRKAKLNKDFQGDFFVGDIPTSTAGNITYRLDVSYAGYQEFTSLNGFNIALAGLQDKKAAVIGNVYLYPLGATAPDQTVTVTYNGERVPNATVLLQPDTSFNTLTTDTSSRLFATAGYQQALEATTDANGIATFSGANLTLGGRYNVDVLPLTYEGKQLAVGGAAPITIGTSVITSVVTMGDLLPGTANGLYVVSASNEVPNALQSSGVLTIKVSQPVEIVNETNTVTASLGFGAQTAALDSSAPGSEVTATVSADGLTITLSPNFATGAAPVVFNGNNLTTADDGLTITYSNLLVRLKGQQDASLYNVFSTPFIGGLVDGSGGPVSGTVNVTPAF